MNERIVISDALARRVARQTLYRATGGRLPTPAQSSHPEPIDEEEQDNA